MGKFETAKPGLLPAFFPRFQVLDLVGGRCFGCHEAYLAGAALERELA